jgi:hypothetical protein
MLGFLLFCCLGCGGKKAPPQVLVGLENAETFELISLEPMMSLEPLDQKSGEERLRGNRVLGKTTIKDKETQVRLIDALKKGAAENVGDIAMCFNPRHNLRVSHEGKTVDLLICFECLQVKCFVDGQPDVGFLTSRSPQTVFDAVLKDAGIPLAQPPAH